MKTYVAVLIAALLVFSGTAFAKTVSGKYAGTQNEGKSILVAVVDEATGAEQTSEIAVVPETLLEGVVAIAELQDGQEVIVEAEEDELGNLTASLVKVAVIEAAPAAPAQQ